MKKSKIILWLIVLILAGVAGYLMLGQSNSTLEEDERNMAVKDTANITRIFLADRKNNKLLLERMPNGYWQVDKKYRVRKDAVDLLLETLTRITVKAPVSKSIYDKVLKNIAADGIKVEVYTANNQNPTKVLYVGTANQEHSGTYMMLEGASKPFLMHIEGFYGFLTPRFIMKSSLWRFNGVFNYAFGEIERLEVDFVGEPESGFKIQAQDSTEYQLFDLDGNKIENYNKTNLYSYISLFSNINFEHIEDTRPQTYMDSVIATDPQIIYKVKDVFGETKTVKTYTKPFPEGTVDFDGNTLEFDGDRLFILIDDETFAVAQYNTFDKIGLKLRFFKEE